MCHLIIETYRQGKTREIYQRAKERGRLMPDGLEYIEAKAVITSSEAAEKAPGDRQTPFP